MVAVLLSDIAQFLVFVVMMLTLRLFSILGLRGLDFLICLLSAPFWKKLISLLFLSGVRSMYSTICINSVIFYTLLLSLSAIYVPPFCCSLLCLHSFWLVSFVLRSCLSDGALRIPICGCVLDILFRMYSRV